MDGAELELVLGDEDAHLLLDEGGVVGLLSESFGVDAAADEEAAGGCGGFEGFGGLPAWARVRSGRAAAAAVAAVWARNWRRVGRGVERSMAAIIAEYWVTTGSRIRSRSSECGSTAARFQSRHLPMHRLQRLR